MDKIERLLRSARPSVPDLKDDFGDRVIQRIDQEKITIKAGVSILQMQKIRIAVGVAALMVSLILFNYNSYALKMNGSLELLYFGPRFLVDFLAYLPWDLIISSLLLTTFSAWMIGKSRLLKRGIALTALVSYLITGVGGVALASTQINETIEKVITQREERYPWLSFFHNQRAKRFIDHPNFRLGRVEEINNGSALVVTPQGEKVRIQLPETVRVEMGQVLRMSGEGKAAVFSAQKVHICNPNRVNRYFSHAEHHQQMMKSCCSGNGRGMMMMRR